MRVSGGNTEQVQVMIGTKRVQQRKQDAGATFGQLTAVPLRTCLTGRHFELHLRLLVHTNQLGANTQMKIKKMNGKVILAALAGAVIGAAGAAAIYAQQAKVAPGYVIAEIEVTDPATFQKYAEQVPATLAPFGGHFLVRGGKITPLEGEAPKRLTVVAFES